MRRDWLLYLVIFSLALNLGTIGTLVYLRWQDQAVEAPPPKEEPLPFRKLMRELDLSRQQHQTLRSMVPDHRHKVRELHRQLMQERRELFSLLKQEQLPEWPPVRAKVQEIGGLQIRLEQEKVHHLLKVQQNLRPEQRQVLMINLERKLSHIWSKHGRHRRPNRHHHGPPGPAGKPPCPPEPHGMR